MLLEDREKDLIDPISVDDLKCLLGRKFRFSARRFDEAGIPKAVVVYGNHGRITLSEHTESERFCSHDGTVHLRVKHSGEETVRDDENRCSQKLAVDATMFDKITGAAVWTMPVHHLVVSG